MCMLMVSLQYLIIKIINFLSIFYRPRFNIHLSFILCMSFYVSIYTLCLVYALFPVQVWVWLSLVCRMGSSQSDCSGWLFAVLLLLQRRYARTAILPPITAFHSKGVRVNPNPFQQSPKQRAEDTLGTTLFFPLVNLTKRLSCIHTCNHLAQRHFLSYTEIHDIWSCTYMSILSTSRMYVAMNLKKYKLIRRKC